MLNIKKEAFIQQRFHETTFTYNHAIHNRSLRRRVRHFTNTGAYNPVEQTRSSVYIFTKFNKTLSLLVLVRKIYKDTNNN